MNILVVEDQHDMRECIKDALSVIHSKFPEAIITLVSTFEAARKFIDSIPAPDTILLDLQLPDSGWMQTLEKVPEIDDISPVVIITGYPEHVVRKYLIDSPQVEILLKGEGFFDKLLGAIFRAVQRGSEGNMGKVAENIRVMRELVAEHGQKQ